VSVGNRFALRTGLLATAALFSGAIFASFLLYERPGLGLGHFYYIPVILVAVVTGPRAGAGAGAAATALYAVGVLINPSIPSTQVLTTSTAIRLFMYVVVGAVTGYFAEKNRLLVNELAVLAERDVLTGLPNTRAFERAITDRLAGDTPFALLVADADSFAETNERLGHLHGDDLLRTIANRLLRALDPGDEVARIGGDEFAVLTAARSTDDAGRVAAHLQRLLEDDGFAVTFGWAAYPHDGQNALSLYRAADERMYARKVLQGERRGDVVGLRDRPAAGA
jgi:diguanylate cyclase (GGDEF)-like protein